MTYDVPCVLLIAISGLLDLSDGPRLSVSIVRVRQQCDHICSAVNAADLSRVQMAADHVIEQDLQASFMLGKLASEYVATTGTLSVRLCMHVTTWVLS